MSIKDDLIEDINSIAIKENEKETFIDSFTEFINCLGEVDLSESTIQYLYDIFIKDMYRYFKK